MIITLQDLKNKIKEIEGEIEVLNLTLDDLPLRQNGIDVLDIEIDLIGSDFLHIDIELK